jgi:hypothetical protein
MFGDKNDQNNEKIYLNLNLSKIINVIFSELKEEMGDKIRVYPQLVRFLMIIEVLNLIRGNMGD